MELIGALGDDNESGDENIPQSHTRECGIGKRDVFRAHGRERRTQKRIHPREREICSES